MKSHGKVRPHPRKDSKFEKDKEKEGRCKERVSEECVCVCEREKKREREEGEREKSRGWDLKKFEDRKVKSSLAAGKIKIKLEGVDLRENHRGRDRE